MAAVLVHIDLDGDRPHASSLVALAAGRHVASSWGATLYAALIARDESAKASLDSTAQVVTTSQMPGLEGIETALAHGGADKIVVAMTDTPVAPLWAAVGGAWQGILDHLRPRLVLFGADSPSAPELGPRTGARIGARVLMRARTLGGDDVELRDRDGGYVRASDSGAAVALIGRADAVAVDEDDIDVVVLALPGGADPRVELAGTQPAELSQTAGALVVLADDIAADPQALADAQRLAAQLGAQLAGGKAAASIVGAGGVVDRNTALAPDLCVAVGNVALDLGGSTSYVRVGASGGKTVDAALAGLPAAGVAELATRLEEP
ncbi:MAG TPA: hypothetical protein VMZ53_03430 [Kofleriaceae bacterium]|nr:hypothetical protein [Kofleriaceae bacterium]